VEIASVLAGVGAGGGVMRARVAERKRWFVERRTAALQQRRCPECDYDLRGTPEPRCPECGEAFTVQEWRLTTAAINDPAN
jgi:RNA polymerase subunit RPABC4/transcription elongation factor Spt4